MALSQVQCLDDNHVNPRTHESKAEFFYCEEQRLALEALLRDGREAFLKHLEARGLRGFLSDPELEALSGAVEPYDPGSELFPDNEAGGGGEGGEPAPLSLHYWPDLSDTSIPQMDLGWPRSEAYRGVTRTTVYTQPPLDGQVHIKEVVRKMIAQAQKVIAVVMDVFTDVDIFRDLMDAGFKRRVSVYILLERTALPHFLAMCHRANMHAGHLKHLRIRCTEGTVFHTRSCTKVRGRMGHRFMFIDGDKAVSGSYSFTWTSSRLDRNLITVITGQAADGFDRLFRVLYASSSSVDLRQVPMDPEPELEPLPQPAAVAPPSAALARKLHNPKYALVAVSNPSPANPAGRDGPKEPQVSDNSKKKKRGRASQETTQNEPPLHPGLVGLEKAILIAYLPTWPEPDPPSDVIGFINVRDANKPTQVHLQRSEMFETSQAIRFSSPFSKAKETLPQVATPRQPTSKPEESNKDKIKAEEPARLNGPPQNEVPEHKSPASGQQSEPEKDTTVNTDHELCSDQDGGHETPKLNAQAPAPDNKTQTSQTVSSNGPTSESDTKLEEETVTNLNTQSAAMHRTHILDSHGTQTSKHEKTDSQTEISPDIQTSVVHGGVSTSSASQSVISPVLSERSHSSVTTSSSTPLRTRTSSSTAINTPLPPSPSSTPSCLNSTPPIPKPRTVQLVIKDNIDSSNGQKLPVISIVRRLETSIGPLIVHDETSTETSAVKESESVPELEDSSDKKNGEVTLQQQRSSTSQEIKNKEGDRRQNGVELQTQTDVLVADGAKSASGKVQEMKPDEPKTLKEIRQKDLTKTTENCREISEKPKVDEGESNNEGTKSEEVDGAIIQIQILAKSASVNIQEIKPEDPKTFKETKDLTETNKNGKEASERQRFDEGGSTSEGTKSEEADGRQDGAELQPYSDDLIADAPKSASGNIQEIIPKDPKTELAEKGEGDSKRQRMPNHLATDKPVNGATTGRESTSEGTKTEEEDVAIIQIQNLSKSASVNIQEIKPEAAKTFKETKDLTETDKNGKEASERQRFDEGGSTKEATKSEEADGAELQTQSDNFITDALKSEGVNIQEILPNDTDPETSTSSETTLEMETEQHQTGSEVPDDKDVTHCKSYLARAHESQIISYYSLTPVDMIDVLDDVESLESPVSTSNEPHICKDSTADGASAADGTHSKQVRFPNTFQEQIPKVRGSIHTPETDLRLHLSETLIPDLRSPTAERSLRSLIRTPTPDEFPPTPDFRTPTPDIFDGYISPRPDSTTSEEYYECTDSPLSELPLELGGFKHTNAVTVPAFASYSDGAAKSDSSSLSTSSLSCQITSETEDAANEDGSREEGGLGNKRESQRLKDGVRDHLNQIKDSIEMSGKGKQASKRKRWLHDSTEKLVDGGAPEGANEATEAKRLSIVKLEEVISGGESRDKEEEEPLKKEALRPSDGERTESTREAEVQKVSFFKSQRVQQQDGSASPLSRPSRSPQPVSASQPVGSLQTQDNTPSPHKPPSGPPPPVAQSKARPGQNQTPCLKPQPQTQTATETRGHTEDSKGPFSFSLSKLYSLRGLKDKMSRAPQSKRGSGSSSQAQRHKSTS